MNGYRRRLLERLLEELARRERAIADAAEACADAIGEVEPADALRAIAAHARATRAPLRALSMHGPRAARLRTLATALRRVVLAHLIVRVGAGERAFRAVLGDVHRNGDLALLVRAIAAREELAGLAAFCDAWLAARAALVARASAAIAHFADEQHHALRTAPALHLS